MANRKLYPQTKAEVQLVPVVNKLVAAVIELQETVADLATALDADTGVDGNTFAATFAPDTEVDTVSR